MLRYVSDADGGSGGTRFSFEVSNKRELSFCIFSWPIWLYGAYLGVLPVHKLIRRRSYQGLLKLIT